MKKIILMSIVAAITFSSVSMAAYADTSKPTIRLNSRVEGVEGNVNTVFVGETVKTVMGVDNFDKVASIQYALRYNKDVITLVNGEGKAVESYTGKNFNSMNAADMITAFVASNEYGIEMPESALTKLILPQQSDYFPFVDAERGLLGMFCAHFTAGNESDFSGQNDYFVFTFNVKEAGDLNIEIATKSDNAPYEESVSQGAIVNNTTVEECEYGMDNEPVTALEKPVTPSNLTLNKDNYMADWDDQANRGYIVQLYKDGEAVGESKEVSVSECDFSDLITESGSYYFTVVAKGGNTPSDKAQSDPTSIEFKLDTPAAAPTWDGTKLSWNVVDKATGYEIELSKDGTPLADTIPVTGTTMDLADVISANGVGEYTARVKATAKNYMDSEYSATSEKYSTGSVLTGYVGYMLDKIFAGYSIAASKGEIKVALYSNGNKYAEVTANEEGYFEFKNVENGTYSLEISAHSVGALLRKTGTFAIAKTQSKELSTKDNKITLILGDINGDGSINGIDYAVPIGMYSEHNGNNFVKANILNNDSDSNKIIDIADINYLVKYIGYTTSRYSAWEFN